MKTPRSPVDRLFRAFADLTRLRILSLLRRGELCVGDLVDILAVPQARVSRHLAYLRRARLVTARKEGLWVHYRLSRPAGPFHRRLLGCLRDCFADVPELVRDAARARRIAGGGCCPPGKGGHE